jgi:long-chain acyl-CoA synthetase
VPPATLTDDLYAHAAARPSHPAVICGEERLTYAELLERVEDVAAGLADRGVGASDAVGLLLPNSTDFVAGFLAITGLGAVAVPLNPQFKLDELDFSIRDSGVRAVIGDEAGVAVAERIARRRDDRLLIATGGELAAQHAGVRLPPRAPDEDFVFMYSSGSTGRPKRVPRTQGQCWAEADSYVRSIGITPSDVLFCAIPLFHTYGLGICLTTLVRSGSTLVIMEDPNPFILNRGRALELLEGHRVTIFPGVPFTFRLLAGLDEPRDLSSMRLCFSAGTALPRPAFLGFRERYGIAVRQLYGSTEAGVMTINVDPDPVATSDSVGTPVPGVEVMVADEGQLAARGPAITRGYAGTTALSRETFHDGWYFTGDLGRVDNAGRVFVTGRRKLLIEVAGHKVDPVEVEDVLVTHPKVREAVVVGVKGRVEGEEIVKAAVVPVDGCQERELIAFCQERLANFKVPQIVEFREEIPKSPLGKILRKYLID